MAGGEGSEVEHDYRLGSVPKPLRRRANRVTNAVVAAVCIVTFSIVFVVEGVRPEATTWVVVIAAVAALAAYAVWRLSRFSPDERVVLEEAQRRVLPPLPPLDGEDAVRVALRPGWWRRRLLDVDDGEFVEVVADADGLRIPRWLFVRPWPDDVVIDRIPWGDIERWRVQADSDRANAHVLELANAPIPFRTRSILRVPITDEVALLDRVRRAGIAIDLEAPV